MGDEPADPFSEACGLHGPLRVLVEGLGIEARSTFEFRRPFVMVGRDPLSDVRIDDPAVSRRHAYFQVVDGRVLCVDLGSRTGVRWEDGARPVGWVDRGQGVEVGPVRVRFEGEDAGRGGNLPISRTFDWGLLPDARLEFPGDGTGRGPWQVSRALVLIGRSPICRVRLDGPGIGRIHAALVRTPAGIWVADLHGPHGIIVGDSPARFAHLEDGDEIRLAGRRILVRVGPGARPSGRSDLARRPEEAGPPMGRETDRRSPPATRPDPSGSLDSSVAAKLLGEFDRMHQRTTEQFQQAILMMFRMHQDQMSMIRGELSRLDRLEEEQRALREELGRGTPERPSRVALRLVSGDPSPPPPRSDGPLSPPGPADPRPPEITLPDRPDAPDRPTSSSPPPSSDSDPDPHARLARRIAEIQDERQGLWKRLLSSLAGEVTDRDVL